MLSVKMRATLALFNGSVFVYRLALQRFYFRVEIIGWDNLKFCQVWLYLYQSEEKSSLFSTWQRQASTIWGPWFCVDLMALPNPCPPPNQTPLGRNVTSSGFSNTIAVEMEPNPAVKVQNLVENIFRRECTIYLAQYALYLDCIGTTLLQLGSHIGRLKYVWT